MAVVTWRLNQWKVPAGSQKIQWRSLTGCDFDQILKFWHPWVCHMHKQHYVVYYLVDIEHGYDFNRKVCIKGQDLGDTTKGQSFNYISF